MTEWKKVMLGDLCDFINGGAWSDKEYVPKGIPVLKVTNCKNSGFVLDDINYLPYSSKHKYSQNELQLNDVIIATVGSHPNLVNSSAGRSIIVNSAVMGYYLNQNAVCIRSKNTNVLNQLYFGYYSKYYLFQNYIQMRGKGAANQMRIAISAIKDYPFPLPPIDYQVHIATILSRYDALIENYQKQIRLLEEAAQRLYKEWFVDLRFPGYESTKNVDGVPEGWEKKTAQDFFNMSIGKTPPRAEKEWFSTSVADVPWVSISDMKDVMFVYETNEKLTKEACKKFNIKVVPEGTILLSFKLTVGRVSIADIPVCTNEAIAHFIKEGTNWREYTLLYLRNYHYDSLGNTSGISKAVNSTIIKNMPFLMPIEDVLNKFSDKVSPLFNNIKNLSTQIRHLTEARDRLLPKLMRGEINLTQSSPSTSSAILASPRSSSSLITSPRSSSSLLDSPTSPKI